VPQAKDMQHESTISTRQLFEKPKFQAHILNNFITILYTSAQTSEALLQHFRKQNPCTCGHSIFQNSPHHFFPSDTDKVS
jgi:hypothetical protein